MGGGTGSFTHTVASVDGLSPRGRGNLVCVLTGEAYGGSIPAWAGGTDTLFLLSQVAAGLSPRGRGNRTEAKAHPSHQRSIPAWAGEPAGHHHGREGGAVYPRVGGGTSVIPLYASK